jgi:hypothetical protein
MRANVRRSMPVLLALESSAELRLASIVSSQITSLGATSTALALARIALGGIEFGKPMDAVYTAIRNAPQFAALITAIESALQGQRVSYSDGN